MNNPKRSVGIIGSCVTRDAFVGGEHFEVTYYLARTSILSIYSQPVQIDEDAVSKQPSPFLRRCFRADFEKTVLAELSTAAPEIVVLDFIDERFDVFCKGDLVVSKTWEMYSAGLWRGVFNQGFVDTPKFSQELLSRMRELARRFYADLTAIVGSGNVYIHQAECTPWYLDNDGKVCEFDAATRSKNDSINMMIRLLVSAADGIIPDKNIINIMQGTRADVRNRWGLTGFHYEAAYFSRFVQALDKAIRA